MNCPQGCGKNKADMVMAREINKEGCLRYYAGHIYGTIITVGSLATMFASINLLAIFLFWQFAPEQGEDTSSLSPPSYHSN